MLPRAAPTMNATINGIVAKSPKGNTWLPGKITANNTVIGTKINAVEITAGCPKATAASKFRGLRNVCLTKYVLIQIQALNLP